MSRTDEKLDVAADEIKRDLCGCSSLRVRDSGLIIAFCGAFCFALCIALLAGLLIGRLFWGIGETVTP